MHKLEGQAQPARRTRGLNQGLQLSFHINNCSDESQWGIWGDPKLTLNLTGPVTPNRASPFPLSSKYAPAFLISESAYGVVNLTLTHTGNRGLGFSEQLLSLTPEGRHATQGALT